MKSRRILAPAVVTLALWSGGRAEAQPEGDVQQAAARYQAAEAAMARQAFAEAAREYEAAHALSGDPMLLYKAGGAHARAGACEAAGAALDRYLAEGNPTPEYRAQAEEVRATCTPFDSGGAGAPPTLRGNGTPDQPTEAGVGAGAGATPGGFGTGPGAGADPDLLPAGAAGPSFTDTPTTWKRSTAWVATGTTIGLVAIGAVLAMSAEGSEQDLEALTDFRLETNGVLRPLRWDEVDEQYLDLVDEGERFDRMATYAFAAAGVTAAVAVTFFVLDSVGSSGGERGVAVTPTVERGRAGMNVGWRF